MTSTYQRDCEKAGKCYCNDINCVEARASGNHAADHCCIHDYGCHALCIN
jgi:hypothetical protein